MDGEDGGGSVVVVEGRMGFGVGESSSRGREGGRGRGRSREPAAVAAAERGSETRGRGGRNSREPVEVAVGGERRRSRSREPAVNAVVEMSEARRRSRSREPAGGGVDNRIKDAESVEEYEIVAARAAAEPPVRSSALDEHLRRNNSRDLLHWPDWPEDSHRVAGNNVVAAKDDSSVGSYGGRRHHVPIDIDSQQGLWRWS